MKRLLGKSPAGLFATRTLSGHLIRGAVVAMRGCPACWTIGLVETMLQRQR